MTPSGIPEDRCQRCTAPLGEQTLLVGEGPRPERVCAICYATAGLRGETIREGDDA